MRGILTVELLDLAIFRLLVLQDTYILFPFFPCRPREAPGQFKVVKIHGDGRCMFRALAQGMARHQGIHLSATSETQEADQLRGAIAEALCRTKARRRDFQDALLAVQVEGYTLNGYCRKLLRPTFWGGEPELLVLSKMLKVPIYVFTPPEDG